MYGVVPAAGAGTRLRPLSDDRPKPLVEKPADPPSTRATRGFYAFSPRVFAACRQPEPSATGQYELTAAVDRLVQAEARVEPVPLRGRCVNVNTPADVVRAERLCQG